MFKKVSKGIKIILIFIGGLILGGCALFAIYVGDITAFIFAPFIFLAMLSEHHTIDVNNTFSYVDNCAIKEIIQREFDIEDTTYIKKITYKEGFDDGRVYDICIHYKKIKNVKQIMVALILHQIVIMMKNKKIF